MSKMLLFEVNQPTPRTATSGLRAQPYGGRFCERFLEPHTVSLGRAECPDVGKRSLWYSRAVVAGRSVALSCDADAVRWRTCSRPERGIGWY